MKKIMQRLIVTSLGIILCIFTLPTAVFAKDNCSFWFGSMCFIGNIKLPHTDDEGVNANLLTAIKNAINWCLGMLATVVLCFCMYGWFRILISWSDSKWYNSWWKIIKNALIWLAIILLAWMIVSVVFWFVATLSQWNQTRSDVIQSLQN
jgi:hypothetical protein